MTDKVQNIECRCGYSFSANVSDGQFHKCPKCQEQVRLVEGNLIRYKRVQIMNPINTGRGLK